MSNFLVGRNLADPSYDVFSGTGAQTGFTLTTTSSTAAATVTISGVTQRPGTDFTISGTTLTFTTAPASGTNNVLVQYNKAYVVGTPGDATVTTAKLDDDAVTLAKMAAGTAGNLITYDASGDPAAVATGTTGQVLTSGGAGAVPTFQTLAVAQELTLIGTVTASNDASVTVTGLTSAYDTYLVIFNNMFPTIDDEDPHIRLGDSGGVDSGASDYQYWTSGGNSTTTTVYSKASNTHSGIQLMTNATDRIAKDAGEGCSGSFILHRPSDGTTRPRLHGHMVGGDAQNDLHFFNFSGARKAYIAVDRVNFYFDTNNIVSGKMTVWGIG